MSDSELFGKCARRLIPFIFLLYLVNFIDRVNVGFAALTMNRDLSFDPARMQFTGDAEANKLLTREYRKPYVVPDKV